MTTEPSNSDFTDNFGKWLEANGVELDDRLDDGVWRCNLDMNTLKAAILANYVSKAELETALTHNVHDSNGRYNLKVELRKQFLEEEKS